MAIGKITGNIPMNIMILDIIHFGDGKGGKIVSGFYGGNIIAIIMMIMNILINILLPSIRRTQYILIEGKPLHGDPIPCIHYMVKF